MSEGSAVSSVVHHYHVGAGQPEGASPPWFRPGPTSRQCCGQRTRRESCSLPHPQRPSSIRQQSHRPVGGTAATHPAGLDTPTGLGPDHSDRRCNHHRGVDGGGCGVPRPPPTRRNYHRRRSGNEAVTTDEWPTFSRNLSLTFRTPSSRLSAFGGDRRAKRWTWLLRINGRA